MTKKDAMPWQIVIAACVGMFAATSTGSTRSPFLPDMAQDLAVSLPAIANLFGITATFWGLSSYITGYASDRYGRFVFLTVSPVLLGATMWQVASVQTYPTLVLFTVIAGLCCGAYTATAMAEVSVQTPVSHQGRALGYVMTGQSLTLLVGVPLSAWIGAQIGWRGVHLVLAALAFFSAAVMLSALLGKKKNASNELTLTDSKTHIPDVQQTEANLSDRKALTPPIIRLFTALVAERLCFGLATFYYASYLRTTYGLSIGDVAMPLIGFALGNISGTFAGGHLADKFPYRRISFAVSVVIAGFIAIPWFAWQPGLSITIFLGVAFAFFNALSRPPLLAALADVPKEHRGFIMGLNSSIASIGWLAAALLGGWLYAGIGFAGFSPLIAIMCLFAALVVIPDSRMRLIHTT